MGENILTEIRTYFGYKTLQAFAADWKLLSDLDKTQIKTGIADGTFTY